MNTFDRLYEKLSAEYDGFIEGLKSAPPDKIIESAYEKVFKEDILMCFEDSVTFDDREIDALLALDSPLNALYRNWLDTDVSYMDDLRDTIGSFIRRELELQNKEITAQAVNGEIKPGDWVVSTDSDDYSFLVGQVAYIVKLGTPEHAEETDNNYDSVHVDFGALEHLEPERIAEIEAQFSQLYRMPKVLAELPFDDCIMPPDALIRITELGHDEISRMGNSRQNCNAFCACFATDGMERQLMARLEQNLNDYHSSLKGFGKQELVDMAVKIAAMQDVYNYMTTTRGFDEEEIKFYLRFENPLEVVADAWVQRNADQEDLSFTLDFVFERRYELEREYPLMNHTEPLRQEPERKLSIADRLAAGKKKAEVYKAQGPVNTTKKETNYEH